jgi:hypothetical protein
MMHLIVFISKTSLIGMSAPPIPYTDFLSEADSRSFRELRLLLASPANRYHRNKRLELARTCLLFIHRFCVRNADDDWKRCLASGICWLGPDEIAVNSRQLRHLLGKSKSSVNTILMLMRYAAEEMTRDGVGRLCRAIPYLERNRRELRQWTLRRLVSAARPRDAVLPEIDLANADQEEGVEAEGKWDGTWEFDFFC